MSTPQGRRHDGIPYVKPGPDVRVREARCGVAPAARATVPGFVKRGSMRAPALAALAFLLGGGLAGAASPRWLAAATPRRKRVDNTPAGEGVFDAVVHEVQEQTAEVLMIALNRHGGQCSKVQSHPTSIGQNLALFAYLCYQASEVDRLLHRLSRGGSAAHRNEVKDRERNHV